MALADALGLNLVETFLAFLRSDEAQRHQLLTIAGPTDLLDEVEDEDWGEYTSEPPPGTSVDPTPTPDADDDGSDTAAPTAAARGAARVPLPSFEDLTIAGAPILIGGDEPEGHETSDDPTRDGPTTTGMRSGGHHRAPIGTDLSALDALGMRIAIAYELLRLRNAGHVNARLVIPGEATFEDALVVDVHSPKAIEQAEDSSAVVERVMQDLQASGISRLYPGCDLLTVRGGEVDRLIELKSSTADARVQEMSWNEWKTHGRATYENCSGSISSATSAPTSTMPPRSCGRSTIPSGRSPPTKRPRDSYGEPFNSAFASSQRLSTSTSGCGPVIRDQSCPVRLPDRQAARCTPLASGRRPASHVVSVRPSSPTACNGSCPFVVAHRGRSWPIR